MRDIDSTQLREILNYDLETGLFTWKKKIADKTIVGRIAGCGTDRYVSIRIYGILYYAHRLVFTYIYGKCESPEIDHINGNKQDNRLSNLRLVTTSQNKQNLRKPNSSNTTGYLGVSRRKKGFSAHISLLGDHKFLGVFKTPEEAHQAYIKVKREFHPFGTL